MNNNEEPSVEMSADNARIHFGQNEYNSHWQGSRVSRNIRILKTLAFPLAVSALLFAIFSKPTVKDAVQGSEVPPPNITGDLPIIPPRIQSEADYVNRVRRASVSPSPLGKISVLSLRGSIEIPVGTEARAVLSSGATNGIVKARLTSPVLVDGDIVIPEKSVMFGRGNSGEERLYVEFTRAVLASGETIPIRAEAFDASDKILGLKGELIGARTKKMAKAMAFGFLGGMADGLQQQTSGTFFMQGQRPSIRDGALAGASKAMLDQSQMYIDDMKNTPNVIEVKQGSELYLIFDEPRKKEMNE